MQISDVNHYARQSNEIMRIEPVSIVWILYSIAIILLQIAPVTATTIWATIPQETRGEPLSSETHENYGRTSILHETQGVHYPLQSTIPDYTLESSEIIEQLPVWSQLFKRTADKRFVKINVIYKFWVCCFEFFSWNHLKTRTNWIEKWQHQKNISSNQLFSKLFSKTVSFTKFCQKCVITNLRNFHTALWISY